MTRYLPLPIALLFALVIVGCEDDPTSEEPPPTSSDVFSTTMTGYQGPNPVLTPAWGEAHFEVTDSGVDYEVTIEGLLGATQAHIHHGGSGDSGPVIFDIFAFDEAQDIEAETFTGTVTEADLQPQESVGFDGSLEAFLDLAEQGRVYINTHTVYNPANDIRGQIRPGANNPAPSPPSPVEYTAELDGDAHEINTDATGSATIIWDWEARELQYEVLLENIDNVTQAHIHSSQVTGPIVTYFSDEVGNNLYYTAAPDGTGEGTPESFNSDTVSGTIEHAYFTESFDGSFQQLYELMRDGEAFLNVHTTANPGGEIGGQLGNGSGNGNGNGGNGPGY